MLQLTEKQQKAIADYWVSLYMGIKTTEGGIHFHSYAMPKTEEYLRILSDPINLS